uniref:ARAD1D15334p n=1 Tax=Blastobotrys adeninivorans TaxID=409370 RepID=A0A060TFG8_BLAAD
MSLMDTILSVLPQSEGLLPKWMLFISVVSLFNSAQTYTGPTLSRRVYEAQPQQVTALSARTFGTWTILTSIVRLYGSYYTNIQPIYDLCIFTYLVAGGHFISEWLVFGTAKLGKGLAGPLIVASTSTIWMLLQRDFYID